MEILGDDHSRFPRLSNFRMLKEVETELLSFLKRFISKKVASEFGGSCDSFEKRGVGVVKEPDEIDKFSLHDRLRLGSSDSTLADPTFARIILWNPFENRFGSARRASILRFIGEAILSEDDDGIGLRFDERKCTCIRPAYRANC